MTSPAEADVIAAAEARASALVRRNTGGVTVWRAQQVVDPCVVVVGDTAVLHAQVTDVIVTAAGDSETSTMPMTQVWVRGGGGWLCLAGHAGPRLR